MRVVFRTSAEHPGHRIANSISIAVFAAPIALTSFGHLDDGPKQICTAMGSNWTASEHFFCPSAEVDDGPPVTSRGCGIGGYNAA